MFLLTIFFKSLEYLGSVTKRQFRRCLTKPRSKPFSILPTVISKHCLLLTVTRRLACQTRKLFIYLKSTTYEQISRPTYCLKPRPKLNCLKNWPLGFFLETGLPGFNEFLYGDFIGPLVTIGNPRYLNFLYTAFHS